MRKTVLAKALADMVCIRIMQYLHGRETTTFSQIQKEYNIKHDEQLRRRLMWLVKSDLVQKKGSGRGATYFITTKMGMTTLLAIQRRIDADAVGNEQEMFSASEGMRIYGLPRRLHVSLKNRYWRKIGTIKDMLSGFYWEKIELRRKEAEDVIDLIIEDLGQFEQTERIAKFFKKHKTLLAGIVSYTDNPDEMVPSYKRRQYNREERTANKWTMKKQDFLSRYLYLAKEFRAPYPVLRYQTKKEKAEWKQISKKLKRDLLKKDKSNAGAINLLKKDKSNAGAINIDLEICPYLRRAAHELRVKHPELYPARISLICHAGITDFWMHPVDIEKNLAK